MSSVSATASSSSLRTEPVIRRIHIGDVEATLIAALGAYVNGSEFVTSLVASEWNASATTKVDYDFFHFASLAGEQDDADLDAAAADFATSYVEALIAALDDGTLDAAMAAVASEPAIAAASFAAAAAAASEAASTAVAWARGHVSAPDATDEVPVAHDLAVRPARAVYGVDDARLATTSATTVEDGSRESAACAEAFAVQVVIDDGSPQITVDDVAGGAT